MKEGRKNKKRERMIPKGVPEERARVILRRGGRLTNL